MKHSAAILGILCLLLLSGCRIVDTEGVGTPPAASPVATYPVETLTPAVTPPPEQTQDPTLPPTLLPTAPPALTAEELSALALEWSETYADRFAGYNALHQASAYWFAGYAGEAAQMRFAPSDGLDGTILFLPADGALDPANAAALMLGEAASDLILVDRARAIEDLSARMAALVGENLNEETALDAFLKNARYVPALGENMWYCVNVDDTGYLLMTDGSAYRLQRMAAMLEYAETPMFQVNLEFDRALEAYGWFVTATLPTKPHEPTDSTAPPAGEVLYSRVDYPGISSMLELRLYLKTIFSDEIVDSLMGLDIYREVDGVLYAAPLSGTGPVGRVKITVFGLAADRLVCQLVDGPTPPEGVDQPPVEFLYERVGDKWVFTDFSWHW